MPQIQRKVFGTCHCCFGKKEDIDKIHGLGLGADDYMTKPFSPSELVARVKAHINRYESLTEKSSEKTAKNETIEVGDLKIDRTARRVFVRGEEKNLTSKEFDLLYFLAKIQIMYSRKKSCSSKSGM